MSEPASPKPNVGESNGRWGSPAGGILPQAFLFFRRQWSRKTGKQAVIGAVAVRRPAGGVRRKRRETAHRPPYSHRVRTK